MRDSVRLTVIWYQITVVIAAMPVWLTVIVFDAMGISFKAEDVVGQGELLLVSVPLAVTTVVALTQVRPGRQEDFREYRRFLVVAWIVIIAAQVAMFGALTILTAVAKMGTSSGHNLPYHVSVSGTILWSMLFFVATTILGTLTYAYIAWSWSRPQRER